MDESNLKEFYVMINTLKESGKIPQNTVYKRAVYPGANVKDSYLVSDMGTREYRVYSLYFKRFIKLYRNPYGRDTVSLRAENGKTICCVFARLVCSSFRGIPENYTEMDVQHLDENMQNDSLDNLEWASKKENNNMPMHKDRISKEHFGRKRKKGVVEMYNTPNRNYKDIWGSIKEASEATGVSVATIIQVCNGSIPATEQGRVFRFANITIKIPDIPA